MASWRRPCSFKCALPTERRRAGAPALFVFVVLAAGCGHADDREPSAALPPTPRDAATDPSAALDAASALCIPAPEGSLLARMQGSIDAEIAWDSDSTHCLGGSRPQGEGVRLIYKGSVPETGDVLVLLGLAGLQPGQSARNVPVNLTVVREGTGQFFATRGEDKCALDSVSQVPFEGDASRFRLEGRGYCTQPARAVTGEGAVLLSRFDVVAIVAARPDAQAPTPDSAERAQ
jgi:hypothetical protein